MSSRLEDPAITADSLLVERHWAGDTAAFGELYRRHYARLLRFVRLRVHEPEIAEDLAQDAFARALASVKGLRNPERFYPWLTVIARHVIARHRRHSAQVCRITDADARVEADGPDSELLRMADREEVARAMQRLRRRHREILELRVRDELSYEDIATKLNVPLTTVAPLLFRAREALRREYFAQRDREGRLHVLLPAAAVAGWRRLRMRAAQYTTWLPDANALCASATCIAVGVGSFLLPSGAAELSPGSGAARDSMALPDAGAPALNESQAAADQDAVSAVRPSPHAATSPPPATSRVRGVAEISIDNAERANWGREQGREMPIYHEFGPAWFSADPEQFRHDMESTLAGNPEWMEGS